MTKNIQVEYDGKVNQAYDGEWARSTCNIDLTSAKVCSGQVTDNLTPDEIAAEKRRIWKNLCVISFSFLCLFTAFQTMASLQSSLNKDGGLGTSSLSTIYAAIVVSCIFVPSWLMKNIKCKWTLVSCQLCYSAYIVAQFYPHFGTLIPGAIILGFGAAPMWTSKCAYLTQMGIRYSKLKGEESAEPTISRFFGIFFMAFQTSNVLGNLINSLVLRTGEEAKTNKTLEFCGADYGLEPIIKQLENISNSTINETQPEQTDLQRVYMMATIFLVFALVAPISNAIFVDPISRFGESDKRDESTLKLLMATLKQLTNPIQLLIIPLTLWSGFEQAFLTADFTAAYVTCGWGVENIGFVLMCYGATDAIGSLLCGSAVKKLGRIAIFIFAAVVNFALMAVLLHWKPDSSTPYAFFLIAALWGLSDGIWQTQINGFYGVIFADNQAAAFSNYRLWESLGFIIAYAYSSYISVAAKLYVLFAILTVGMIGYLIIEDMERRKPRQAVQ